MMNILIKQNPPPWRLNQFEEATFESRAKDKKTVYRNAKVEDQFSKEELEKIQNACKVTAMMGNPSITDPQDPALLSETTPYVIK